MAQTNTMKIPLTLHIGTHKTGTSSIQSFLANNSEKLAEQKVLYPQCYRDYLNGHHVLAYSFGIGHPVLRTKWSRWKRPSTDVLVDEMHRKECQRILLSTEVFANPFPASVAYKLKKYLSEFEVSLLIYLRRQDFYLCSFYAENVKTFFAQENIAYLVKKRMIADYSGMLNKYANVFGKENIKVRVFEKQQMPDGLFADFMQAIDCQIDDTYRPADSESDNIGFTPETTELIRFFNKNISEKLQHWKVLEILLTKKESRGKSPFGDISLPEELRKEVLQRTRVDNEHIAREYLGRTDGKLFHDPEPEDCGDLKKETHLHLVKCVLDSGMFKFLLDKAFLTFDFSQCIDFFMNHVASSPIDIQDWPIESSAEKCLTLTPRPIDLLLQKTYLEIKTRPGKKSIRVASAMASDVSKDQRWACYRKTKKGYLFGPASESKHVVKILRIHGLDKSSSTDTIRLTRLFSRP